MGPSKDKREEAADIRRQDRADNVRQAEKYEKGAQEAEEGDES
jgi:hypothetical protein